MSELAKRISEQGSGVYHLSRKDAGETYRAAKKLKRYEITYWNRNKNRKKEAK